MAGRHARKNRIPYGIIAAAIALIAGGAVVIAAVGESRTGATANGAGSMSGAAEASGGDSSAVITPGSSSAAADAKQQPAAAATPTPAPERGRLVIHGTGDVSLDPTYVSTFAYRGYEYAFSGLGGLFRRDDLTVINLECAVSELGAALAKRFTFRCDPEALPVARRMGVEVASLGNNHAYDYGPEALLDSVRNVRRAGLAPVGAGATQDRALAPVLFELNGWTVAVVGLDMVVDPYPAAVARMRSRGPRPGAMRSS